jgi:hypothetical protein
MNARIQTRRMTPATRPYDKVLSLGLVLTTDLHLVDIKKNVFFSLLLMQQFLRGGFVEHLSPAYAAQQSVTRAAQSIKLFLSVIYDFS